MRELPPTAGLPLEAKDFFAPFLFHGRSFEALLKEYLQAESVEILSSGTLCLSIAFEAIKQYSRRNRIILPAYTCPLVAIAAHAAGMEIVVCDLASDSCEFDIDMLEELCDESIAAVVPTHMAGLPVNTSMVKDLAARAGAFVVEDAAQSLGARVAGCPVGFDGDISVYSLAVGKGLSLYDGGILRVNNPDLRKIVGEVSRMRVASQPVLNISRFVELLGLFFLYNPNRLDLVYGRNLRACLAKGDLLEAVGDYFDFDIPAYKFDEWRKKIGSSALCRLPDFVRGNRQRGLLRSEYLRDELGFGVLQESDNAEGTWPFLMVVAEDESQRDEILKRLWCSGLGITRLFIHDLASYDYLKSIVPQVSMPKAKSFAARSFSITNSPWLTDHDFEHVVEVLKCFSKKANVLTFH